MAIDISSPPTSRSRAGGFSRGNRSIARALFPDATFHPHDPHLDGAVWEDILYLLADISPRLRSLAPGWALLDPFDLPALAALNRTLRGQIGTAAISIAAPRFTAMLAALQAAPGEAIALSARDVARFQGRVPIAHLAAFGFGEEIIERLQLFGLTSIGRLMGLTRRHLNVQFGSAGAELYDLLHPKGAEPPIPLFQPPPTVSAEYEFELPAIEPAELLPALDHLLTVLAERLGALHAQLLTLRLTGGGPEGTRAARRLLKAPTARRDHLRVVAETMLAELMRRDRTTSDVGRRESEAGEETDLTEPAPPEPVSAIRVELGGLVQRGGMQGGLFEHRPAVYETVKTVHRRFPGRLLRAVITDPDAYIPETGTRFEPYPTAPGPPASSGAALRSEMPIAPRPIAVTPSSPLPVAPLPVAPPPSSPLPAAPPRIIVISPLAGRRTS
jgi:hypothetical protein